MLWYVQIQTSVWYVQIQTSVWYVQIQTSVYKCLWKLQCWWKLACLWYSHKSLAYVLPSGRDAMIKTSYIYCLCICIHTYVRGRGGDTPRSAINYKLFEYHHTTGSVVWCDWQDHALRIWHVHTSNRLCTYTPFIGHENEHPRLAHTFMSWCMQIFKHTHAHTHAHNHATLRSSTRSLSQFWHGKVSNTCSRSARASISETCWDLQANRSVLSAAVCVCVRARMRVWVRQCAALYFVCV
jgi:hypothetical protein